MDDSGSKDEEVGQARRSLSGKQKKKAYQRPRILYREPLEVMAALCVPSPPAKTDVATCTSGPLAS